MKWPSSLTLIRHAQSQYNAMKEAKKDDPYYRQFLQAYDEEPYSPRTQKLAGQMAEKYSLRVSDANTKLSDDSCQKAARTAAVLSKIIHTPDIIYISPYTRTRQTFALMCEGWPRLKSVPTLEDERLREQEHGLATLYNDWKIFFSLYPEQGRLHRQDGTYWYRWPQGENVPDVRLRNNIWITTLVREFSEKNVLVVTHHLNILATRANLERWPDTSFISIDKNEAPTNLGVTHYRGDGSAKQDGKLCLTVYNKTYWDAD